MNDIFTAWINAIGANTILSLLGFCFVFIIIKKFFDQFRI